MAHKITMTIVKIITPNAENYPSSDPQAMLDEDIAGANGDPFLFIDDEDAQITIVGELL